MKMSEYMKRYGDIDTANVFKKGDVYYYVNAEVEIIQAIYFDDFEDWLREKHFPIYKTKEECQEWISINKDFIRVSSMPDYHVEKKFYIIYYSYLDTDIHIREIEGVSYGIKYCFCNKEDAESLIEKWGKEKMMKYILNIRN